MSRFFLTLDIQFHPENGRESTFFSWICKGKREPVLSVVSHVETENQSYSLVISLAMELSLLIFEFFA